MNAARSFKVSAMRPLAACLAVAFSQGPAAAFAEGDGPSAGSSLNHPQAPQIRTVLNCNDSGPGSLRDIVANPNSPDYAQSGDTVDLGQLPASCGMAESTITLTSGEITISQNQLTLAGPDSSQRRVTLSAGNASRVIHGTTPTGSIYLRNLGIANGYAHAQGLIAGGCIYFVDGSVHLNRVTTSACTVLSDSSEARGGAIYARYIDLDHSNISNSQAKGSPSGLGGGLFAGGELTAKYSALSGNVASGPSARGGGAYVRGIFALGCTIEGNASSYWAGAISLHSTSSNSILDSTISGNSSHHAGALFVGGSGSVVIANSTITSNSEDASSPEAALTFGTALHLESSIVANNLPADLHLFVGGSIAGKNNIVIASDVHDPLIIPISEDPMLGPLQSNGGPTKTHALKPGSPAIGAGDPDALGGYLNDQRGDGYPRATNVGGNMTTDIGAFQFDTIFSHYFDHN